MTATRLYVIVAREARRAVVFRRGPSKHVRLLLWHLESDRFEGGQWLKGRIYERRCDLSPDGTLLIYFASNYGRALPCWTAVSKPPFLTALALWPKRDAWGGGGLFETSAQIGLNHRPEEMKLADGYALHRRMRVHTLGDWSGRGEDAPISDVRLQRDGWTRVGEPQEHRRSSDDPIWIEFDPPIIYRKPAPSGAAMLEMRIRGIKERDGPWYVVDHVLDKAPASGGEHEDVELAQTDWADWDDNDDLLFAREGRLYRLPADAHDATRAIELIDLRDQTFEQIAPSKAAKRWFG